MAALCDAWHLTPALGAARSRHAHSHSSGWCQGEVGCASPAPNASCRTPWLRVAPAACEGELQEVAVSWMDEMTTHAKREAPKQLVALGTEVRRAFGHRSQMGSRG